MFEARRHSSVWVAAAHLVGQQVAEVQSEEG